MFAHKIIALAVALAATTVAHPGFADGGHGPGHGPGEMFMGPHPDLAALDTDGDGKVSQEEMKAARTAEFKTIDTNPVDGYITLTELQVWAGQKVAAQFKSLDTDSNGLSLDEFVNGKSGRAAAMAKNVFKLADANGDGSLSAEEFTAMASQADKASFYFAAMDADSDGQVSEAEYIAPPPKPNKPGHGKPRNSAE